MKPTRTISNSGTITWWLNDKLHREDGPAIEYIDGSKGWYKNGLCHREDGPAIEYADGSRTWFVNNTLIAWYTTTNK